MNKYLDITIDYHEDTNKLIISGGNINFIPKYADFQFKLKQLVIINYRETCLNLKNISYYKNLEYLRVGASFVDEIPESISELKNLNTIAIEFINIRKLPDVLFQLPKLKKIFSWGNKYLDNDEYSKKAKEYNIEYIQT